MHPQAHNDWMEAARLQAALRQAVREHASASADEGRDLAQRRSSAQAQQSADHLLRLAAAPTAAIVLMQGNPFQTPSFVSSDPIAQLAQPAP